MFTKITNSLIREPRLTASEFRILCYLLSFSPDNCYPSYAHIMNATGIKTFATVNRSLRELKRLGVLDWIPGKKGSANRYKVKPESSWDLSSRDHLKGTGDKATAYLAEYHANRATEPAC